MTTRISPRLADEAVTHVHSRVMELVATGVPLSDTLDDLARLTEETSSDGMLVSVVRLDENRRRPCLAAAPSLPSPFVAALEAAQTGGSAFRLPSTELAFEHGLRTSWSTPIVGSDGGVDGEVISYYRTSADPSAADRDLAAAAARAAAIAIEHDRRRTRLEREVERLQRLYRLTDMLGRARALSDMYEEGMSAVQDLLGVRRVSILLFDTDRVMRFKAWRGLSDDYRAAVEGHTPWTPEDVEATPIVVPDVSADPELAAYGPVFEREQIAGLAFFPLRTQRVLGKFMAYFDEPRALSADELRAAEAIAHHMAIAVERAQHEEKLYRANALLSGVFEQTADVVFVKDREGRYVIVNPVAASVAGVTPADMVGRTARQVFPSPTGDEIMHRDETLMSEGLTRSIEEPIQAGGPPRTFLSTKGPWRDASGRVIGLIGISRDITERKRAEEQLNVRARQHAAVADFGVLALSDVSLETLMERAASIAREVTGGDWSILAELHQEGSGFRRRAAAGQTDPGDIPSLDRLAVLALESGSPVTVADFTVDERFAGTPREPTAMSGVGVVVHGATRPYGVLCVVAREAREFSVDDAYCVQSIANILGMALERNTIADASRRSEERFRSLSACSPTGIFLTDINGHCNYTNASCQRICGFTAEGALGTGWADNVHPDDRDRVFRAWTETAASGRDFSNVFRWIHADGSVRWAHVRTAAVIGDRQQLLGHVGTVEDITETREITEALRQSEGRYRSLVTATAQIVWTARADGAVDDIPAWRELTGQTVDEVRGHGWLEAIHPEDRAATRAVTQKAAFFRRAHELEYRIRMKDGRYRYFLSRAVPVLAPDGSVREWVGTCTDIDDHRHGMESIALLSEASAVLASSLVLEEMLEKLGRLLLDRGADLSLIALGDAATPMVRHIAHRDPEQEARLREFVERYPLVENPQYAVSRVISTGHPELLGTIDDARIEANVRSDEQLTAARKLQVASAMILPLAARSRVLGALVVASQTPGKYRSRDLIVGEELASRAALAIDNAVLYAEAYAANRAKDEFLAMLSHELRTPMTAILGWTRMLQLGDLDEETGRLALQSIDRSTRAQAQIVEDILDVSRIITGKMTIDPRALQVTSVIHGALEAVRPAAEAKKIKIHVTVPPGRRTISGDPNRLQQVLWNLVSNAIKFTPPKGRVDVAVGFEPEAVTIKVSDTGQGIARELLPHVFERFRQADSSSTRAHGGLGLGLAIARHLIELHGGTVTAGSAGPGQGATFTVRLPLRTAAKTRSRRKVAKAVTDSGPRLPSLKSMRVLVVDDDEQTRTFVTSLLTQCGAEVRASRSVAEAMTTLDGWSPHVLVSDLAMPQEDGYSLILRLRRRDNFRPESIAAIALTAYGRPEDRERAISAGFEHFVQKPIEPLEFARLIAGTKERRRRARNVVRARTSL